MVYLYDDESTATCQIKVHLITSMSTVIFTLSRDIIVLPAFSPCPGLCRPTPAWAPCWTWPPCRTPARGSRSRTSWGRGPTARCTRRGTRRETRRSVECYEMMHVSLMHTRWSEVMCTYNAVEEKLTVWLQEIIKLQTLDIRCIWKNNQVFETGKRFKDLVFLSRSQSRCSTTSPTTLRRLRRNTSSSPPTGCTRTSLTSTGSISRKASPGDFNSCFFSGAVFVLQQYFILTWFSCVCFTLVELQNCRTLVKVLIYVHGTVVELAFY